MKQRGKRLLLCLTCLAASLMATAQTRDSERLGMALDYYCSGKYHEALILFERLDRQYELNPRFHAYMGICYHYEQVYDMACQYLDAAIPHLGAFSPIERFTYYYTDAESHFALEEYEAALSCYEQALTVCPEQKRIEVMSRLEWCRKMTAPAVEQPEGAEEPSADEQPVGAEEPSAHIH